MSEQVIIDKQVIPIVTGKAINELPETTGAIVSVVLNPPTPLQIINNFLRQMPEPQEPIAEKELNTPIRSNNPMQTVSGASLNGKPLYANLEITGRQYTDFNGQTKAYDDMTFNTVLVSAQQVKHIVETNIQGSDDGAVFEYSGMGNYDVSIDIIITGSNGVYPQVQVENLLKALTAPVPLQVNSWYLQMFDINELIIHNYDFPQEQGGISQQLVKIQAKSSKRAVLIVQA